MVTMRSDTKLRYLVITMLAVILSTIYIQCPVLVGSRELHSWSTVKVPNPRSKWSVQTCCLPAIDQQLDTDVVLITNWTTKMKRQVWMADGNESFVDCPNLEPWMQCWYDHRPEAYNQSYAVIFRGQHVFRQDPPKHRPLGQKWIIYETEPPTKLWGPHLDYDSDIWKAFNMTMTYTTDSTIPNNIYRQRCILNPDWISTNENYAKGKRKNVAWFVSNCDTPSKREIYVKELQQHIDVDVFGGCGELDECPRGSSPDSCITKTLNEYKFYLSFENSLCEDYYTEKLVRTLWSNVVPIVMGLNDYSTVLPPGSFLDVRNFSSPQNLARFLREVSEADERYNSFIEAKKKYVCQSEMRETLPYPCRLCYHLHMNKYVKETVTDVRQFWGAHERCETANDFFRSITNEGFEKSLPDNPKGFEYKLNS